jgi:hypothetical protein
MATKMWVTSTCMWCKSNLKIVLAPHITRMWVASTCKWCKSYLKIASTHNGNKKIGLCTSICMWYKSDLKIALKLKGIANLDNSWEKNLNLKIK